jgi:tetratricopeptide (TPR) repeat protein
MSDGSNHSNGGLVSPALLDRFLERIGEALDEQPHVAAPDVHRKEIAALLESVGGQTHYELLGVGAAVGPDGVAAAFSALARRVHPRHAVALGLPEPLLRLLFEHAVRAYLVLSDPDRRRDYDKLHRPSGTATEAPRNELELQQSRREMARSCFTRAQAAMHAEHYHLVVELLRDAVRWEPRAEAFALLGEAMSRNPRWRSAAVEQFREAVQLAPKEPAYHLRLAQLLEEAERFDDAAKEFRLVLERMPKHPEALAGLERLRDAARPG